MLKVRWEVPGNLPFHMPLDVRVDVFESRVSQDLPRRGELLQIELRERLHGVYDYRRLRDALALRERSRLRINSARALHPCVDAPPGVRQPQV